MNDDLPAPRTEAELDDRLTQPSPAMIDFACGLAGDLIVLGAAGKMGVTLAGLAARALRKAGRCRVVWAVSRFSERGARERLEGWGVRTLACDLLDRGAVAALPDAPNVVFMAGRKFGTTGDEPATWAANVLVPAVAAERYRASRIVAFSTGCVYPLVAPDGGNREDDPPAPVGEYAQACLGRERVFQHFSGAYGTRALLLRLNYAVDLRYGVLHDIARAVHEGRPVDVSAPYVNCLWQGDANERALRCLAQVAAPPALLNLTGPERLDVRETAQAMARRMGRTVTFAGTPAARMYLSDASRAQRLFGPPGVPAERLIEWTADWVAAGGASLGKPTHFEVTDGKF